MLLALFVLGLSARVSLFALDALTPLECLQDASPRWLQGQVTELGQRGAGWQLAMRVTAADGCEALERKRIRISFHPTGPDSASLTPGPGQQLHVLAQLRAPWGSLNPGGFNYRLWLVAREFVATGYAREVRCVSDCGVAQPPSRRQHEGLIRALALGDRSGVSREDWALFRATGTIHLMVVSGLHVGIFAGLVAGGTGLILRLLVPLWHGVPSRAYCLLAGAGAALLYAHVGGWGAPVTRAAASVAIAALLLIWGRRVSWVRALMLIAGTAVLAQPGFVLQQGFWLSYGAVAALLGYFSARQRACSPVRAFVCCQLVLLVALSPLQAFLVGTVPMVTVVANLVVVPIVSFLAVPCSIFGILLTTMGSSIGERLLFFADVTLHLAIAFLTHLPSEDLGPALFSSAVLAGLVSMAALMPIPTRIRAAACVASLSWLSVADSRIVPGEARIIVLDVGQGAAAIVDTARHRLLVDTGPAFRSGLNMGAAVVIPALRRTGAHRLNRVLLTHLDLDHAGGLAPVVEQFPTADVLGARGCREVMWTWDGVRFQTLNDPRATNANDASCTLLVTARSGSAYLPGDIGQRSELALLRRLPEGVSLLVAPHHGSGSSSHPAFVARLKPEWVVVPASRSNRYGHPRPEVVNRYARAGAGVLHTGIAGAVTWRSDRGFVTCSRLRLRGRSLPLIGQFDQTAQVAGQRPLFLGCEKLANLNLFGAVTNAERGPVS